MKDLLQRMYDDANWYGYALHKGKHYSSYRISQIAMRLNIEINYTPAI